jgi:hypothetical protein
VVAICAQPRANPSDVRGTPKSLREEPIYTVPTDAWIKVGDVRRKDKSGANMPLDVCLYAASSNAAVAELRRLQFRQQHLLKQVPLNLT